MDDDQQMKKRLGIIVAAAFAQATAGLALSSSPPRGGTISISVEGAEDAATPIFVAAVTEALADKGFTVLDDPGHAANVLKLDATRSDVGTALGKVPRQSKATLSGGLVVPLSTGKSDLLRLQRVRLEMRILRRGEEKVVWSGAAVSVRAADARIGTDQRVATDLSRAILEEYPVQPLGVVGVP